MGKKKGTDVEIALKLKMFLAQNRGQSFAVDHLARELDVGWRRIKRLLKVAEILQDIQQFPYGKTTAYMIPEEKT